MESFISLVSKDIIRRFGTDLRRLAVVFPNKRAGLFLNRELAAAAQRPVWAPRVFSISDLFHTLSPYIRADNMLAVCTLHSIYARLIPHPQSLDSFYGWGEIMLNDFDDIDKNLADAKGIFKNIAAIKEINAPNFLSPEQQEALKHFFSVFSPESNSQVKERFLELWNNMFEIYSELIMRLKHKGMLYEGALCRDVIEHLSERLNGKFAKTTYVFVGFNALSKVEYTLFTYAKRNLHALFYWDYDVMYTSPNSNLEAGTFIRQNLLDFPNALPPSCFNNLHNPPKIEYIASSSENAHARFIPQWLESHLTEPEDNTAIVLCNESLLQPVLHSLPNTIKKANITMGFPLSDTPAFSFVNALLSLQVDGYDRNLKRFKEQEKNILINHPYYLYLEEKDVFIPYTDNKELLLYVRKILENVAIAIEQNKTKKHDSYTELHNEALYRAHEIVTRFVTLVEEGTLTVQATTLRRLIRNVMKCIKIPFHGEPAVGLQVMGMLETRSLDFKSILVLSANEGMLPKATRETSFVPYPIRQAFGLTTTKQETAIYAYNFYRLLQRSDHVTLMYNIATEGGKANEPSRFLRQLQAETNFNIKNAILQSEQTVPAIQEMIAKKTPDIIEWLKNKYSADNPKARPLSPSALNAYIDCPLKFFYQQIVGIRKPDNAENKLDAALFGTIFHRAAELALHQLADANNVIKGAEIEKLLKSEDNKLTQFVEKSFLESYFGNTTETPHYNGQLIVAKEVMTNYLRQLLKHDSKLNEFILTGTEETHFRIVETASGNERIKIKIGGKIDRLDTVMPNTLMGNNKPTLRVVDYKTGGSPQKAKSMEEIFTQAEKRPSYIFQIFLYSYVMESCQNLPVSPNLFFVNKAYDDDYVSTVVYNKIPVTDFEHISMDFEASLQKLLAELFNPCIPFRQTEFPKLCEYCDYKELCRK